MNFVFDLNNITAEDGVPIAITGLVIVFVALSLIATAIALLPKVLQVLEPVLPKPHEPHKKASPVSTRSKGPADLLIAAAAASAFHHHKHSAKPTNRTDNTPPSPRS